MKIDVIMGIGTIYLIICIAWYVYLERIPKKISSKYKTSRFRIEMKRMGFVVCLFYFSFLGYVTYNFFKLDGGSKNITQDDRLFLQTLFFIAVMISSFLIFYYNELIGRVKFWNLMWEHMFGYGLGSIIFLFTLTYKVRLDSDFPLAFLVLYVICYFWIGFYKWWRNGVT